jgi:hypothetical protein
MPNPAAQRGAEQGSRLRPAEFAAETRRTAGAVRGYDFYSSGGKPWWLNGRDCYRATFRHFAPRGEGTIAAGVVEFDEALHIGDYKGRYGVLLASYSASSVAWLTPEDTVVVYVSEPLPQDVSAYRFDGRASPDPVETHATYRLQATSGDR